MRRTLLAGAFALLGATTISAAPVNQGFENGLVGWTAIGNGTSTPSTNITTFNSVNWQINAFLTQMGFVNSNGVSIGVLESTLGLAAGALTPGNANPNGGSPTNGSALYQDFNGVMGSVIDQWFNYTARDYTPFNDPAYAVLINLTTATTETVSVLASILGLGLAVDTAGNSGWNQWTYTLPTTGNYRLAFITTNDKDTNLDSALFLDNAAGSCVPNCPGSVVPVPVPASLTLLGSGLLALALVLRRRRRDLT